MKIFTCKKTLAAVVLSCLFSTAYAQKSLTITTEAGKLSEKIPEADRYNVTELKISGSINGTDILLLRKMAGKGLEANAETNGKLSSLDISEAKSWQVVTTTSPSREDCPPNTISSQKTTL